MLPRISHLFFADDSLIFGRATARESAEIQRVLQIYELSSGQQLNRNKTSIFFSHNLICQTFMLQDVDAILSIPFSANRARDRLIWAGTKNGKFSVRSAYKMAQETEWGVKGAEPSDPTKLREIWRHVWGMNTPNKLKHFAWKACKNILATKENLKRRNITKDSVCEACGEQLESACHIFWFCDKAKEV